MHQTKKGNQWHFGMKAHIGVDAGSGLAHTVVGTAANVNDVTQAHALVHGEEMDVFADSGYQGVGKCGETQDIEVNWYVAMRPGKRKVLDKGTPMGAIMDKLEQVKARIRAKVEHPFRAIKRQLGHVKVRTAGWQRTRRSCTHCLHRATSGWYGARCCRKGGDECICRRPEGRETGRNRLSNRPCGSERGSVKSHASTLATAGAVQTFPR